MKPLFIIAILAALTGCATFKEEHYATKSTVVLHQPQPGKFVATQRNVEWVFGPTLGQRAVWLQNHGK